MSQANATWAFAISAGLVIGAWLLSGSISSISEAKQTLEVTGSAKKKISSDIGYLRMTVATRGNTAKEAYDINQADFKKLKEFLTSKGFTTYDISPLNNSPIYRMTDNGYTTADIIGYAARLSLEVSSNEVQKIKDLSLELPSLVQQGLNIEADMPRYLNTKLGDIKIEMQAEASKNAKQRAEKIAEATEAKLGKIVGARMGVLQITPLNSIEVSDYGINDNSSIEKEVTAVVNLTFSLK